MQDFLREWASLSFVSMSGGAVRKFEGDMMTRIEQAVDRVLPSAEDLDAVANEEEIREATRG